ncbi:hypothetical protein DITRI_Ditri02bG0070600 [Diplodiscus trichospermus]
MVLASQRSGTPADKVSAFSFVVADNPVANLKSLDGLWMLKPEIATAICFLNYLRLLSFFWLLYERFVVVVVEASRDMLPALKDKGLKAVDIDDVNTFLFQPPLGLCAKYHTSFLPAYGHFYLISVFSILNHGNLTVKCLIVVVLITGCGLHLNF